MAIKTTTQIEQAMYDALEEFIHQHITGEFYLPDMRPLDAKTEDAVITCGDTDSQQIQHGRARLNIYVPDTDFNGRMVPNIDRIDELSAIDKDVIEALNDADTDYNYGLFKATGKIAAPNQQHIVNINIEFDIATFNDD